MTLHDVVSQGGSTQRRRVQKKYKHEAVGRRYGGHGAAQGMSRMDRSRLLPPDVVDVDIKNAMTTLVAQVLLLLDIGDTWPSHILGTWMECACNTDEVLERIHRVSGLPAKRLLLRVAHGAAVPDTANDALNRWLDGLSSSARFLR